MVLSAVQMAPSGEVYAITELAERYSATQYIARDTSTGAASEAAATPVAVRVWQRALPPGEIPRSTYSESLVRSLRNITPTHPLELVCPTAVICAVIELMLAAGR